MLEETRSYHDEVISDNPVGFWKLDETSGVTATDEQGVRNGAIEGAGTVLGVAGLADDGGTAFEFDGAGGVDLGFSTNYTDVSFEAWFRVGALVGTQSIVSGDVKAILRVDTDTLTFYRRSGTVWTTVSHLISVATTYHVVATHDGTTMVLYVNGEQVGSVAFTGAPDTNTVPWNIGRHDNGTEALSGVIDNVAIYDTALSAARVAAHYAAGAS